MFVLSRSTFLSNHDHLQMVLFFEISSIWGKCVISNRHLQTSSPVVRRYKFLSSCADSLSQTRSNSQHMGLFEFNLRHQFSKASLKRNVTWSVFFLSCYVLLIICWSLHGTFISITHIVKTFVLKDAAFECTHTLPLSQCRRLLKVKEQGRQTVRITLWIF